MNPQELLIKVNKEALIEAIHEGIEHAFNEHGYEIKIKNLEEVSGIVAPLLVDLRHDMYIPEILLSIKVQLEINVPIQNTYIISYLLEGQETWVDYHLDYYRIPSEQSVVIVQILTFEEDLPPLPNTDKTRTELMKEVFGRYNIEVNYDSAYNPYDEFYFSLPIEVEVKKFWI